MFNKTIFLSYKAFQEDICLDFDAFISYESAHTAFKAGILTEEDWETVDTYIDDVGAHLIFIEAVYWGHDGGNYSKAFAEELKKRYSSRDDLRQAALEIYPDIITNPNWAENMEKR